MANLAEYQKIFLDFLQSIQNNDAYMELLQEFLLQCKSKGIPYLQKMHNSVQYQETLLQILQTMNRTQELAILLPYILDKAIEITNAERGYFIIGKQTIARNYSGESLTQEIGLSRTIIQQVQETKQPVLTNNARLDPKFQASASIQDFRLLSILSVPLLSHNKILGVLYIDNRFIRGNFTEYHKEILTTFAEQASIAIENAQLHEKLQQQAQQLSQYNLSLQNTIQQKTQELNNIHLQLYTLSENYKYHNIYSKSPKMKQIFRMLDKLKKSDISVLIQGESGTGKDLIAQAIHATSQRKNNPFISENCAAIAQNLFESELFGYKKGAFTGATCDHQGLFQQAHKGTLFLDEIGELNLDMQKKLLRVLEEKKIRRVGDNQNINIDIRIITATNKNLREMVQQGDFREDLYYRLNTVEIDLPPLRERPEDIPLLIEHFLQQNNSQKTISADLLAILQKYPWPGNIRQLKNEIQRLITLSDNNILEKIHLSKDILHHPISTKEIHNLPQYLQQIEQNEIKKALQATNNNKSQAAKLLGISRFTLIRKLEKFDTSSISNPK
ncbi:MAG: sigma-54-dependent Fis family transcriptional regulator [Planctomycetes bacterium]|nr:sigma-54-dependent Fis family transcriptional regulator [Planctomycetota bacterium]